MRGAVLDCNVEFKTSWGNIGRWSLMEMAWMETPAVVYRTSGSEMCEGIRVVNSRGLRRDDASVEIRSKEMDAFTEFLI